VWGSLDIKSIFSLSSVDQNLSAQYRWSGLMGL